MEQIFWLRENRIAGRTGPNRDSWNPADFKAAGFSAILSVNHADMVDPAAIRAAGLKHANIPMSSNAPPLPDDHEICLRNLPLALQFIEANIPIGPVIIHCRSGKDRTGLVMAAALMKLEDLTPDEAWMKSSGSGP
ncbi:protein-tyrosine phosphatase family protein [Kiloniella sp. b19]|uniref:protein-tyrosine phosphatase family protein n=1 Tax=Kiloniella sp. GXU_MW_B19 TaxID=3141326 RepID=UPI0031DC20B8